MLILQFTSHTETQSSIKFCDALTIGSQLERKDHLMAQLQLRQRSKKKKQHQDIYSHSSLLNNLPGSRPSSELPHPIQEGAAPIQEPAAPIQEGAIPTLELATPIREGASPIREGASPVQVRAQGEVCVASFPSIISHEHFLNEDLVNRPYLTLVFTLVQYRQE